MQETQETQVQSLGWEDPFSCREVGASCGFFSMWAPAHGGLGFLTAWWWLGSKSGYSPPPCVKQATGGKLLDNAGAKPDAL